MRDAFAGELEHLGVELAGMCDRAAVAIRSATRALLTADLRLAEQVLSADAGLDEQRTRCDHHAQVLLALQAPVAHDLRAVLAVVYCAEKVERMGDLAAHVAATTRYVHPEHAVPDELVPTFTELGEIAAAMADQLVELINTDADHAFAELAEVDHRVDQLHAEVLARVTDESWPHGVRAATNLALLARFYERFADHAVSTARRLEFVATGAVPK